MKRNIAIVTYILLFLVAIFGANLIYTKFGFYKSDILKCNAELLLTMDSSLTNSNIMYLGESSNFTYSEKDSCKKSISGLIADFNPNYRILTLTKGAIHAGTYNVLVKHLHDNENIKVVIVTLNLRSFGINWIESDLETNLSRANIFYRDLPPIAKKLLVSFKAYDNKEIFQRKQVIKNHYKNDKFNLVAKPYQTVRDWDKEVFDKGILGNNGVKNQEQTDVACHFIKNYAFVLNEKNQRICDLDEIIAHCRKKDVKLIFNLLPENFERASYFFQKDLSSLMRKNVQFLKERYSTNSIFIDNSEVLADSCFIDRGWPTEHYIYYGRSLIANRVNQSLNPLIVK